MAHVVVVGAQWGDEGKGKIVDWLASHTDWVVRFQGGHNAGHTLVIDGATYKLSLLPSGVVRGKPSVIGNGVVLDPWAFLEEIERLRAQGVEITPKNLSLAETCPLILPLHRELDALRENRDDGMAIGTTRRGIGPAYEDKTARRAIRLCDLADDAALTAQIDNLLHHHNALRRGFDLEEIKASSLIESLKEIAPKLLPFMKPTWRVLETAVKEGDHILFEGAQGALLDVDHGTYPFVTSSHTIAGQASAGAGIGPGHLDYILGLVKAYTTRVGEGPFPTELLDETGQRLGERGAEFGTVTGRSRRCGWFDAVAVRQMAVVGGLDGVALTKLDVLDGFETLKICTGYKLDGQILDYLPAGHLAQSSVEPVYESLPGWKESTHGIRSWEHLPRAAKDYVHRLQDLIGVPVALISTSPEREDVILAHDPFEGRHASLKRF